MTTGAMSLGVMFALIALGSAFLGPFASLVTSVPRIRRASAYLDRVSARPVRKCLQEPVLFSGTIRDNVALHSPDAPERQIAEAARLAEIHDEIARMPMGFDTWLREGGGGLSGGQRQRIALARALAARPTVLVLDEATSHLDALTERRIHENLRACDCTQIVIAHRLSTIRDADLIVVLDEGRVAEAGRHTELMARGGHYAALVDGQLERDTSPARA